MTDGPGEHAPADDTAGTDSSNRSQGETEGDVDRECHRRGCSRQPDFRVTERYLEETGQGPVEATASLCREHADEESPTNLGASYDEYVFLVEPLT